MRSATLLKPECHRTVVAGVHVNLTSSGEACHATPCSTSLVSAGAIALSRAAIAADLTAFGTAGRISNTRVGWTAGGGGEWMFLPNWSVKAEYLYFDLGRVTYSAGALIDPFAIAPAPAVGFFIDTVQSSTRLNGHVARAGIKYSFNWFAPSPAAAQY